MRLIGIWIVVFWAVSLQAQNLVMNGGFEQHTGCPDDFIDAFAFVNNWVPDTMTTQVYFAYGTPDYYHPCATIPQLTPPLTLISWQYPYEGDAYSGLSFFKRGDYRESIRTKLLEPMIAGKEYCVELYYNMADTSTMVCDKFGVAFSPDSFKLSKYIFDTLAVEPQIYTDIIAHDTATWYKLDGRYTAQGGEEWMTIGWLFPYTEMTCAGDSIYWLYLFIDQVSVYQCDSLFLEESIVLPQLLTPNNDGKNDAYFIEGLLPHTKVWIYNRWGNEVYYSENYQNDWAGTWNGNRLPSGTYFIQVVMPMGTRKTTYIELMY